MKAPTQSVDFITLSNNQAAILVNQKVIRTTSETQQLLEDAKRTAAAMGVSLRHGSYEVTRDDWTWGDLIKHAVFEGSSEPSTPTSGKTTESTHPTTPRSCHQNNLTKSNVALLNALIRFFTKNGYHPLKRDVEKMVDNNNNLIKSTYNKLRVLKDSGWIKQNNAGAYVLTKRSVNYAIKELGLKSELVNIFSATEHPETIRKKQAILAELDPS